MSNQAQIAPAPCGLVAHGLRRAWITSRMDYVDALRGGACIWAMLNHTSEIYVVPPGAEHTPLRILSSIAYLGWLGVSLFWCCRDFAFIIPSRAAP